VTLLALLPTHEPVPQTTSALDPGQLPGCDDATVQASTTETVQDGGCPRHTPGLAARTLRAGTAGHCARPVVEVLADELGPSRRWATVATTRARRSPSQ
jgi:hypothetical protein